MCLIRSRIVYATPQTTKSFRHKAQKILSAPRDTEKCRLDICDMQAKVQKQYGTKDPWQMKYRAGGVMDMMFALHYLILCNGHKHTGLHHACFADAIAALKTHKLLSIKDATSLQKTADLAIAAQAFLRLTAELPFSADKATTGLKQQLAAHLFPAQKKITYAQALRLSARLFRDSAAICKKILSAATPKRPRKKTAAKK
jgi:glutamate-ammonia-ligase adenylyltransferase